MELDILNNINEYAFSPPYSHWLLRGVLNTIIIASITTFLSLILGALIAAVRLSQRWLIRTVGIIYINVFRNVPVVPFLLFLAIGLPGAFLSWTGFPLPRNLEFLFLITVISLNSSAYISEIFRSGYRAIPTEMTDSARILGLSHWQIKWFILFPQIFSTCLPSLTNRLVHNLKNSALAIVIPLPVAMMEVLGQAKRIEAQTFSTVAPYLFCTVVYLFFALGLSWSLGYYHRKYRLRLEGGT